MQHNKNVLNCKKFNEGINVTPNQQLFINKLNNDSTSLIVVSGPAGTGKTMFACNKAIDYLVKTNKKIIITRPLITVDEELGFLPGDIDKKMQPWTTPLFDYFLEFITKDKLNTYIKNNKLEICPLAFMRGRTFNNAFIIADEMQNSTPNQMKMLVTRLGKNSRLVITGDTKQTDLNINNGLTDIISKLELVDDFEISLIRLINSDISRSSLVNKLISLYEIKP
jgi:phosphate starvation-inducible PhoH-like protein